MTKLLIICSLIATAARASLDRIQALKFDQSKVERIYLSPGLGSMLIFPCGLIEVFVGRSDDVKVQISPTDKRVLLLNLKLNSSLPTNLIARCESERSAFVFDLIPSRVKHQDIVDIRSRSSKIKSERTLKVVHEDKPKRVVIKERKPISEVRK